VSLRRETVTARDQIDPEDLSYARTMTGKYIYWITALMFLMLAWLFAVHVVRFLQLGFLLILIMCVPDMNYSVTSSWGDGAGAWAAIGFHLLFAGWVSIFVPVAGCSLWKHWRIAGRIRRGEL
jgi:hypothetical protein